MRTGFATIGRPDQPLHARMALAPGQSYYFWIELGPPVLHGQATASARLKTALFAFEDDLAIAQDAAVGEFELLPDGSTRVSTPAGEPPALPTSADVLRRRLFFAVRAPSRLGVAQVRCSLYYEQILVQSYLVRAHIGRRSRRLGRPLRRVLDYAIARSLDPGYLNRLAPHRLSLLLNNNPDGTHSFRFFGASGFQDSVTFDGHELQELIETSRGAFRLAAWGDEQPWQAGKAYRYGIAGSREQLYRDLIRFAIPGYRFYDAIIDRLSKWRADELAVLMREPGLVQIAMTRSARDVLPAALLYDYALDTNVDPTGYSLCPAFLAALERPAPLEDLGCFHGACPSRGIDTVVCPSGFWGYRHPLGMPLTLGDAPETPPGLAYERGPFLDVVVSTDPGFHERLAHEQALRGLRPDMIWNYADSREAAFALLKSTTPHVVYFYCHGGIQKKVPYIQVGPGTERGITPDNLRAKGIRWEGRRPLVFINGCQTTAVEPEHAFDFVRAFVSTAGASGVIGTEITIFEPLARAFAEECLRRFFAGEAIGEAVRGTRLALLKAGNPLGLVYDPFVLGSLRLVSPGVP